jgi:hypothetical protein
MWYISFHGGSDSVNNILVYHNSGDPHSQPNVLPTGGSNPTLRELRGFAIVDDLLYVLNAYKNYSQVLVYELNNNGDYNFKEIFASKDTINSILHPYDLTFDTHGNSYVSSQDTNVVTGLQSTGSALGVASYLRQQYPPPDEFLTGTIVASSVGALPGISSPAPPDVPKPQGLKVSFTDSTGSEVANSVRGVLFYDGYLYVSDEPANAVKVYDINTGELYGQIAGGNLNAPVQLLRNESTNVLYIGSSDNDSVMSYDLSNGAPSGTVTPRTFIDGEVKHISGMAFDEDGYFYAAERKAQKIKRFHSDGSGGKDFITDLPDEPEFILYVPKT